MALRQKCSKSITFNQILPIALFSDRQCMTQHGHERPAPFPAKSKAQTPADRHSDR
jgi:hypothetical protein